MNLYDVAYKQWGLVMWSVQPWDWRTSQVSPFESRLRGNGSSLFSCKSFTHRPAHILKCYSKHLPVKWVQFELASCTTARPGTHGFCYARTVNTSLGSCMNVTYPTSCVKCATLLFDFNEIWSLWIFLWRFIRQFSRKSFQWGPSCFMRTDRHTCRS
jgi:hypothetical protein